MRRVSILFSLLMIGYSASAQSSGFRFGPSFGIGSSRFIGLPQSCDRGLSLCAGVTAHWQFGNFFSAEFMPSTVMYSGQFNMNEGGVTNARGGAITYRDIYYIYAVEFPVLAKVSAGSEKVRVYGCIGPGLAFTMGGSHSKKYDDPYNATNGFVGHSMRELSDSYYLAIAGAGVELEMKKGVFGIDLRMRRTNTIAGVEGMKFDARSMVVGLSWKIKS